MTRRSFIERSETPDKSYSGDNRLVKSESQKWLLSVARRRCTSAYNGGAHVVVCIWVISWEGILAMDSLELRNKRKQKLNSAQKSLIVGTILGDGHVLKTTMGYCLRIKHSIKQKELVDWKHTLLENISTPPKIYQNSYYFRTVSHPELPYYRNLFYRGKRKRIPRQLLRMINPLALAVWIMDDGTNELGHTRALRINSHCFNLSEHKKLQSILRAKFGFISTINRDKDMYRLRIAKSSMSKLRKVVTPYIVPSMLYKISP